MRIFLYGPPGSGKTAAGECLAQQLGLPFYDLDREIEVQTGSSISQIFARVGEQGFRRVEREVLERFLLQDEFVLALGGGTLLSESGRAAVLAAGYLACLTAERAALLERLTAQAGRRPLLEGNLSEKLNALLEARSEHYASFPLRIDTSGITPGETAWQVMGEIGRFRLRSMGSGTDVYVRAGLLSDCGSLVERASLQGRVLVVSDENTAPLYAERVRQSLHGSGLDTSLFVIPAGEKHKNMETLTSIWEAMLFARLDRRSTLLALGGGVVTDLAGFAAATFLRGIAWTAAPTTLLGMVDASLGGKTGIDLPQGKNLVGAFYPPRLVIADPTALSTLPEVELRNGLAEVVKHSVLASPGLFESLSRGLPGQEAWEAVVREAAAVKMRVIEADPYESGQRVILNLGHTVGHAIELASGFRMRHGEAIAAGMGVEARIGEALGVTKVGTAGRIEKVLTGLGLPASLPPGLDIEMMREAMRVDKKRRSGKIALPLPVEIRQVRWDVEIEDERLWHLFLSCMDRT